jgi:four helix bundle protein
MFAALGSLVAKRLDELPIHSKANDFWAAVNAILQQPAVRRNRKLLEQIEDANDSVLANMSEGFEEPTDKALEKYLFGAKASAAEA